MRRLAITLVVVGGAAFALPSSAAAFDHHFAVQVGERVVQFHETPDGFALRINLYSKLDPSVRVGREHRTCVAPEGPGGKSKCRNLIHLNGVVGGTGDLLTKGNFGQGDHVLQVVNGSGDFNGVAGKVIVRPNGPHDPDKMHFDLIR